MTVPDPVFRFRQAAVDLFGQELARCPIGRALSLVVFLRVGVHFAKWLVYPNTEPGCSPACPPPGSVRPRARILRPLQWLLVLIVVCLRCLLKVPAGAWLS